MRRPLRFALFTPQVRILPIVVSGVPGLAATDVLDALAADVPPAFAGLRVG